MTEGITPEVFGALVRDVTRHLDLLLPEAVVALVACLALVADLGRSWVRRGGLAWLAFAGLAIALGRTVWDGAHATPEQAFRGMLVFDTFAWFVKSLILGGALVTVALTWLYRPLAKARMGEYWAMLLGSVVGMMLMVSAADMVMVYLSIEFVSLTSFVLVAYIREDRFASEASLKYIIYSAVASGMMIYGFSLFYGLTGTTNLGSIATFILDEAPRSAAVTVAAFLTLAGFGYKMAMVPFHFWCPDVYQGAPTPVTAFLSVTSKAAGVAIFLRFLSFFGAGAAPVEIDWTIVIAVLAALSMTVGNLAALHQGSAKRLLAYSSMAHVGYVLMGAAAWEALDDAGFTAAAFYLLVYSVMNLGAFAVVLLVEVQAGADHVEVFRGLGRRSPFLAVAMTIFLFSLIGVPPTAGFVGKFILFRVVIDNGLVWLAVVAALNTAISVYTYARIIKNMFLETEAPGEAALAGVSLFGRATVLALLVPVLWLGVFFNRLLEVALGLRLLS